MKDIEIATTNLEIRLDALGRMLVKHTNVTQQIKPVSQSTIQVSSKGHTLTHSKRYSFRHMSIEEDKHLDFDFGTTNEDIQ